MPMKVKQFSDSKWQYKATLIPCHLGLVKDAAAETWQLFVACQPLPVQQSSAGGPQFDEKEFIEFFLEQHPFNEKDFYIRIGEDSRQCSVGDKDEIIFSADEVVLPGCLDRQLKRLQSFVASHLQTSGTHTSLTVNQQAKQHVVKDDALLDESKFVDVVGLDRLTIQTMKQAYSKTLNSLLESHHGNSFDSLSAIFGKDCAKARGKESTVDDLPCSVESRFSTFNTNEQDLVKKYQLLIGQEPPSKEDMQSLARDLASVKDQKPSLEEILLAALENQELSTYLGLLVPIQITLSPEQVKSLAKLKRMVVEFGNIENQNCVAISRTLTDRKQFVSGQQDYFLIQPKSETRTINEITLLTSLHPSESRSENKYSFSSYSKDLSIIKNLILPENERNALIDGTEQALKNKHAPPGAFSGSGITIYGPLRDLTEKQITTKKADEVLTLALEDLWKGYRFDVKDITDEESIKRGFLSVHSQSITVNLDGSSTDRLQRIIANTRAKGCDESLPSELIIKQTEDLIYRLQKTEYRKPPGVCISEVEKVGSPEVHPALYTWNGLGTVQQLPWSLLNDPTYSAYKSPIWSADYAIEENGKKPALPKLQYGRNYNIRCRNVFQLGVSLSVDDANILSAANAVSVEEHTHTRNDPISAGVIIANARSIGNSEKGLNRHIALNNDNATYECWLFPKPVDREEGRMHGLLEYAWKSKDTRKFVEKTLQEFLNTDNNLGRCLSGKLTYFADPDAQAVLIDAYALGNEWLGQGDIQQNNIACDADRKVKIKYRNVQPHHIRGKPLEVVYGDIRANRARPILLRVKISSSPNQRPKARVYRRQFGGYCYELLLPPGELVKLQISPKIDVHCLKKCTAMRELLNEYSVVDKEDQQQLSFNGVGTVNLQELRNMPLVSEPIVMTFVHETSKPLGQIPTFLPSKFDGDNQDKSAVRAYRLKGHNSATLSAICKVDARTTGKVRLQATYQKIIDDKNQPGLIVSEGGPHLTEQKSIVFMPTAELEHNNAVTNQELYSVEDEVIFGPSLPCETEENNASDEDTGLIGFPDNKHYKISVTAVATGRYAKGKTAEETQTSSEPTTVYLPASQRPPNAELKYVQPLLKVDKKPINGIGAKGFIRKILRKYRVYLNRPWYVSGAGEMVAIVFDREWRRQNNRDSFIISHNTSAWGEDPLFRTWESETKNNMGPYDVLTMLRSYIDGASFDDDYPTVLAAELSGDEFNIVWKESDIGTGEKEIVSDYRNANLIAVRPSYDKEERAWYFDLDLDQMTRWCRFSIARFQYHALAGLQLSEKVANVDVVAHQGEQLELVKRLDTIRLNLYTPHFSGAKMKNYQAPASDGGENASETEQAINHHRRYVLKEVSKITDEIVLVESAKVLETGIEAHTYERKKRSLRESSPPITDSYTWELPVQNKYYQVYDNWKLKTVGYVDCSNGEIQ